MKYQQRPEAESNRKVLLRKYNLYAKSKVGNAGLYKNKVAPTNYISNEDKEVIVEFLMKREFLPSIILDLLSFEKWFSHLPPSTGNTLLFHENSRHMTTDTATILGFLTLRKVQL